MQVQNLNGSSGSHCRCCTTWIEHYRQNTQNKDFKCSVIGCSNDGKFGGHIKKSGREDMRHYIIPICVGHNNKREPYLIDFDIPLVSVQFDKCRGRINKEMQKMMSKMAKLQTK
jgi:hypothetical protein